MTPNIDAPSGPDRPPRTHVATPDEVPYTLQLPNGAAYQEPYQVTWLIDDESGDAVAGHVFDPTTRMRFEFAVVDLGPQGAMVVPTSEWH